MTQKFYSSLHTIEMCAYGCQNTQEIQSSTFTKAKPKNHPDAVATYNRMGKKTNVVHTYNRINMRNNKFHIHKVS